MPFISSLIALVLGFSSAQAQILVEDPSPTPTTERSGEKAARKYFEDRKTEPNTSKSTFSTGSSDRFMSVHIGAFLDDKTYRWGNDSRDTDVGGFIGGVSYRIGEWENSMDLFFRADVITYELGADEPVKLSVMPVIQFPDAASGFPLYFGAGIGLGVFFSQVGEESDLSFDYQLHSGLRFPDVFENGGLMFELGYRGHLHLLSSGQFSGMFATAGGAFAF